MASSSLLQAIHAALSSAATLGYNSASAAHDVYEGYVLTLLVQAAVAKGWSWSLRDGSNAPTKKAVFRLGPGRLPSGNFTHVHLSQVGKASLEAHIGVKVAGKSPVVHEFDLLVLTEAVADHCRKTNTDPTHTNTVVHAEAKYYGGNLSLPTGRAVVGLAVDCGLATSASFIARSVLVTNQNGATVEKLIQHYGVSFRFLITPSNPTGEYHLVQLFRTLL